MFQNKRIKELEDKISQMWEEQRQFLLQAHKILESVSDNDKRKFMYEIRSEDVELIEDGKKIRAVRKIIG